MTKQVKHISGSAGGYLVGNSHANGGIQAINKAVGKPLEMEGGEVVITKPAVDDNEKREFEGEMLTNRQILSKINESGGGVSFAELGAELPTHIDFCGNKYKYGGETLTDYEIAHRISQCGCSHDKETFTDGGEINLNPKNSIELKQSLEMALEIEDENQKKKTLEQLQVDFFTNIVAENPKKELTNYYEAIYILPKNKRQYFEYWFSEQESESFQEKLKDNPYNFLPSDLKPEIKIKKLDFSPTPESENLGKIMNIFTGDDALRPKFSGVFFNVNEERIEATDAHKLMFINEKPHLSESMICLMGKRKEKYLKNSNPNLEKNSEGCWRVDESYVNTSAIIPTDFNSVIEINAKKLLQYLNASEYFSNPITHQSILCYQYEDKPTYVGFNSDFLADCLKGMLMLGHSDLEMCFMEAKNRAVVIVPRGNSRKVSGYALKTDLTLCMPVRLDTVSSNINDYSPIYDIENNIATIIGKYENHIQENEDDLEFVPEINQFQENKKEVDKMIENETINIQNTIDGLEILLETAKGKNKTNLIDTIEGLKFLLESAKYENGGQTERIIEIPLSKLISFEWKINETVQEIKEGKLSYSKEEPIMVSYIPDLKKYLLMDGHHRVLEKKAEGIKKVKAIINKYQPKTYNLDSFYTYLQLDNLKPILKYGGPIENDNLNFRPITTPLN